MTDTTTGPRPPIRTQVPEPTYDGATERLLAGTRRSEPARAIPHRKAEAVAAWAASDERIPVFTIDHEDGTQDVYTMPAKPHPGVLFGFMVDVRTQGDLAFIGLVEQCLGTDAVAAMQDELGAMEPDEATAFMQDVSQRIQRNLAGGLKG